MPATTRSVSFSVTVHDTTAPALHVPADIATEASSSSGRVVSFSATATDAVHAVAERNLLAVERKPVSDGTTTVHCSTQDANTSYDDAGNASSAAFNVTVSDAVPPALSLPSNLTVEASSSVGSGRFIRGNRH